MTEFLIKTDNGQTGVDYVARPRPQMPTLIEIGTRPCIEVNLNTPQVQSAFANQTAIELARFKEEEVTFDAIDRDLAAPKELEVRTGQGYTRVRDPKTAEQLIRKGNFELSFIFQERGGNKKIVDDIAVYRPFDVSDPDHLVVALNYGPIVVRAYPKREPNSIGYTKAVENRLAHARSLQPRTDMSPKTIFDEELKTILKSSVPLSGEERVAFAIACLCNCRVVPEGVKIRLQQYLKETSITKYPNSLKPKFIKDLQRGWWFIAPTFDKRTSILNGVHLSFYRETDHPTDQLANRVKARPASAERDSLAGLK